MLKDEIEKELKKYHCWHTPLDCQGCDKSDVCDKETAQVLTHILELVEKEKGEKNG